VGVVLSRAPQSSLVHPSSDRFAGNDLDSCGVNGTTDSRVAIRADETAGALQGLKWELERVQQAAHAAAGWRMQALAEGGLSERARQYAQELATDADLRLCAPKRLAGTPPAVLVAGASRQRDPRVPPAGTQLIKRYKDETLTVTVLEDGYQYGERVYKSLSAIARQVTGTQWNGYLFFSLGLRKEQGRAE
jgi:hypothetical protein